MNILNDLEILPIYMIFVHAFSSMCSGGAKYVSAHGHGIPDLLEAIMKLFPLDTYNFSK